MNPFALLQELKGEVNFVYASQVTYKTQETLIQDLGEFGTKMEKALRDAGDSNIVTDSQERLPYIVVDGCHSFGALEVKLSF